ncbi:MAG TPA: peptide chain release factor N(5)-glutamine methyltransferase [Flavobacteriaceae bacterium]|nr:peptide chain release factor N(5)-glutamine methyltransferase [Flavobacteriaceae bacterium]
MNLGEYKKHFVAQLEKEYPRTEAETFFYWLAEDYLKMKRLQLVLNHEKELKPFRKEQFDTALIRLKNHEPIQYILGKCEFFGIPFLVNPSVLIPRPETEELVNWILAETNQFSKFSILDIGTGSGSIAIPLAKNLTNAEVFAVDISESALELATENALLNHVRVNFILKDIFKLEKFPRKIDILVSNPPYVRETEKAEMKLNVLNHEPETALFVNDSDPLIFYRKIAEFARENLSENGKIFMEINQYLSTETALLFQKNGFKTELRKDIFGNERMLKAF